MDISNALIAKSDQLNAIDLIGAPSTVTIVNVEFVEGSEQPVKIFTDVFGQGRPFKPSKTVLRMLAGAWGRETNAWVGKRMALYREATVRWAGEEVGGIRIQALSDIAKPIVFNLPTSKGKHTKSTVQPLAAAAPPRNWLAEAATLTVAADLNRLGHAAHAAGADAETMGKLRAMLEGLTVVPVAEDVAGETAEEGVEA